jgi:hypothetical protein
MLERIVVHVGGLADEKGAELPWNDRVRGQLFGLPYARLALVRGYFDGVAGARRKN